jgi:uncharacterized protein YgbK (DUF1537 family)
MGMELASQDPKGARVVTSILIVADDLTGANATAALFAHEGLRTLSTVSDSPSSQEFEAVAVCTSSRHLAPHDARARVVGAIEALEGNLFVIKRIDSTLRGNIGAELEGALDALQARTSSTVRALIVAAWPRAGRVTRNGIQLVDGVPLNESGGDETKSEGGFSGRISDIVAAQTALGIREIGLDVVQKGGQALRAELAQGSEALVCDALSDEHLRTIAGAARDVARDRDLAWLPVDPGPFGVELAAALGLLPRRPPPRPLLIVAGSMTATTREQLREVEKDMGARFLDVDASRLEPTELGGHIEELLAHPPFGGLIGVRTAAEPDPVTDGQAESPEVAKMLGEAVRLALDAVGVGGIYATGGDVTAALLEALDADGIEVVGEAMPLAAMGVLVGGPHAGLALVTKGGLVGGPGAAVVCLDHLLTMTRRQQS